ncbi:ATP-dependent DNA helicase srs2 [Fusarium equiseti]|uniref:ATP-dependent DNA helicase srs2 n=1 Tax=Fusarium equiseti TaxID=61235 RepID=A0ABQ8RQ67_FUSEQ|nr:ATP-dependent DNA helicase srs2 [Fusarium equiseti]
MMPTITTRFSTSALQGARSSASASLMTKWNNLSPQNKRYAKAGLTVAAVADVYVHYTYWPQIQSWFSGDKKTGKN